MDITRQNARKVFKGTNFMTSHVMKRDVLLSGNGFYELSSGNGMLSGSTIYGVTIADSAGEINHKLSECFRDLKKAKAYIGSFMPGDTRLDVTEQRGKDNGNTN